MQALGNTGERDALPTVQLGLTSMSRPLRHAAVDALRFIPGDDVDGLLLTYMSSGDDAARRLATYAAVRRPNALFIPAFVQRLQTDPVEDLRLQAVRRLVSSATDQTVALALRQAADTDESDKVRTAATAALGG